VQTALIKVTDIDGLHAIQYRTDGSTVGILGDKLVPTPLARRGHARCPVRPPVPPGDQAN
jgi:hypothetical protein